MTVAPLSLYAPLAGASFDSDGSGLVGGRVLANIPFEDEWNSIQKSDLRFERLAESIAPPLCLVVLESRMADEDFSSAVARCGTGMLEQMKDAVLVLRLFKPGWFLYPGLGETCFAMADEGWLLLRRPGPYRQAFLHGIEGIPFARYEAKMAELTVSLDERGPVTLLWDRLTQFRVRSGNASVEIALQNFNHSYGFQLTPADRLATLFMALDAILGGMSTARIGDVALRKNAFRARVLAALSMFEPDIIAAEEAAWLDDVKGGRGLRNAVAHGDRLAIAERATDACERLQQVIRLLLRQYLAFAVRWADDQPSLVARFKLPEACPLAAAYNKVLESRAAGKDVATDVLG